MTDSEKPGLSDFQVRDEETHVEEVELDFKGELKIPVALTMEPDENDQLSETQDEGDGLERKSRPIQTGLVGVFGGVYLPVLQNILGVILFLRLSWVVGQAGLWQTTLIIALCTLTTFLTILSMNAILTNGKLRTGGVYYVLSRSLGAATGGSIGFLYYLANSCSCALYILGAVETLLVWTDFKKWPVQQSMLLFSIVLLIFLAVIAFFGARVVEKANYVFSGITVISILSIFIGLLAHKGLTHAALTAENRREFETLDGLQGLSTQNFKENFHSGYTANNDFQIMFAVIFNGCNGIFAAANQSAKIRDPARSIPKGTIAAHLTSTFLYFLFSFLFAAIGDKKSLQSLDFIVTVEVAWPWKAVAYVGIIVSSSGAALQQLAGSPNILAAIA